jgi:hypothetical protein
MQETSNHDTRSMCLSVERTSPRVLYQNRCARDFVPTGQKNMASDGWESNKRVFAPAQPNLL